MKWQRPPDFDSHPAPPGAFFSSELSREETIMGRGILLWLLGVPIPIIILLALFMR
jgi:hypothetical protein